MTPDEFRTQLREYLAISPYGLIDVIPAGSGLCHVANTSVSNWDPAFVSTKAGRWTTAGQPSRYFATDVPICAAELGYDPGNPPCDKVIELWETTCEVSAINLTQLPSRILEALFEDKGPPPEKWRKSHILLEEVRARREYQDIRCVYAPSASGLMLGLGGMCFVADPSLGMARRIRAQSYDDWITGIADQND